MTKFIELTDFNNQSLFVNVDNIIWVCPYTAEDGTMIYVMVQGKNNHPVSLYVKESYTQVTKLIQK